ncbi:hypothetical protein TM48_03140 [Mycobacterium shottsii]|uniref:Uncharacterized protein n=1 Tax=Mycobacterium shottsii TaxID=133549 RepID=A0A7I7LFQ8_9MYCO|nr:hypothetical protein TM48_03140 [Mycobacterium shottsii]BBX58851.1 hypothetical protein MSHO_41960 [Mycobacterium shottsii]
MAAYAVLPKNTRGAAVAAVADQASVTAGSGSGSAPGGATIAAVAVPLAASAPGAANPADRAEGLVVTPGSTGTAVAEQSNRGAAGALRAPRIADADAEPADPTMAAIADQPPASTARAAGHSGCTGPADPAIAAVANQPRGATGAPGLTG